MDPASPLLGESEPGLGWWARLFFGDEVDTTANPVWLAEHEAYPEVEVLLEQGVEDFTDFPQARRLCVAAPHCKLDPIHPGPTPFVQEGATPRRCGRPSSTSMRCCRGSTERRL